MQQKHKYNTHINIPVPLQHGFILLTAIPLISYGDVGNSQFKFDLCWQDIQVLCVNLRLTL